MSKLKSSSPKSIFSKYLNQRPHSSSKLSKIKDSTVKTSTSNFLNFYCSNYKKINQINQKETMIIDSFIANRSSSKIPFRKNSVEKVTPKANNKVKSKYNDFVKNLFRPISKTETKQNLYQEKIRPLTKSPSSKQKAKLSFLINRIQSPLLLSNYCDQKTFQLRARKLITEKRPSSQEAFKITKEIRHPNLYDPLKILEDEWNSKFSDRNNLSSESTIYKI